MRPNKTDFGPGPIFFDSLRYFGIIFERRRGRVNNNVVVPFRFFETFFDVDVMGRTVQQLRIRHKSGWLCQPGRIPEARDFAPGLVARTSAAVKTVEARWRKK